jgi:pimeloyl-ACP methyl ester carboxylesterase
VNAQTLLLIARHDQIIPPAHAEALARAFPQPPQIQWLETDHNGTESDLRFGLALRRHFGVN